MVIRWEFREIIYGERPEIEKTIGKSTGMEETFG